MRFGVVLFSILFIPAYLTHFIGRYHSATGVSKGNNEIYFIWLSLSTMFKYIALRSNYKGVAII